MSEADTLLAGEHILSGAATIAGTKKIAANPIAQKWSRSQ